MTVSIAMTTYNGMPYLREQLESFSHQTYLPDELIICDDGSSDATVVECEDFAANSPFKVKVERNSNNIGYTKNFEKALSLCSGDIVFISDQDDYWYPEKIDTIIRCFEKNPQIQLIIHDLDYCNRNLISIGQTKLERIKSYGDPEKLYVTGMATAIRKSFLALCLPIPVSEFIEYDSWLHRCANLIDKKYIIPEILASYRRHEKNVTSHNLLNTSKKTTKFQFKKKKMIKLVSDSVVNKMNKNITNSKYTMKWIENNHSVLINRGLISIEKVNELFKYLSEDISMRESRLQIYNLSRVRRVIPIIKLLKNGIYKEFSGIRSAIKDFFF